MKTNLLPISKDGFKYIGSTIGAFIVFSILDLEFLAFISFVTSILIAYIYRNPERELPHFGDGCVVSPVDGNIISIEEIEDQYYRYKVNIDSDLMNISLFRVPLNSTASEISIQRGAKLSNHSHLADKINENARLIFEDISSNKVKVSHISKQSFSDINIDISKTQNLYQGSRYGSMVNGITEIYLPNNFRLNVKDGDEVSASLTLLGYFS